MKALFTAIYNLFSATSGDPAAHNAFYTALGGNLYNTYVPQDVAMPYCVFSMISGVHEWTFTEDMENVIIQFSLFDSSSSSGTVCDNYALLTALYDECKLTVTSYTHLYMQRESQILMRDIEDPEAWHYMVEYRVLIEKA